MIKLEPAGWLEFLREIKEKNLSRNAVFRRFNKMVPKEDYAKGEKEKLVNYAIKYGSTKPLSK